MRIILLLLGSVVACLLNATSISGNESLSKLFFYAGKNLNYSSPIPEQQVLDLCAKLERLASDEEDYDNMFRIQLIAVNSHCLKGSIGLALNKAQQMYEEARKSRSHLGRALAIQAIGSTFMHSNENAQAYKTFIEAEELLKEIDDDYSKIRLLMQQMHVCVVLNRMDDLRHYLIETRKILDRADVPGKSDYAFYIECYQTFYNLGIKDAELARVSFAHIKEMRPSDGLLDRWYYNIVTHYYELLGNYQVALLYCDSTAIAVGKGENPNEYRYVMLDKAALLEKNNNKKEACLMYDSARRMFDSLNVIRYSQQIDSLHVAYWVDQIEIENAAKQNQMLAWIVFAIFVVLIAVIMLVYMGRKKNKTLERSRKELGRIRTELADSIKSKNLFLSNMSHELRTPLNAIVGFADLLTSNDVEDAETRKQCSDLVRQNSELLLKLFRDVADLSALKEENIRFTFAPCNVVVLCENIIDTVEKVKRTSATLHFESTLNELTLYTDSGRLQQVLINLLINATKFTPQGEIILRLEIDPDHQVAEFSIEDTGCGIPLEKQPHIFERFEKLHENIQGAGLGLSICQLIVEHMGGKIWIDSNYTRGARFVFTHLLNNEPKQPLI